MGVYIKGMEMPRACYYCHFLFRDKRHNKVYCTVHHEFDKWLDISDAPAEGRADDCPLIELPPHGRLIDADALMEKFLETYTEYERKKLLVFYAAEVKQEVADMITDAPTIIPAEEGE